MEYYGKSLPVSRSFNKTENIMRRYNKLKAHLQKNIINAIFT